MTTVQSRSLLTILLLICFVAVSTEAIAQVPARFYWKSLAGAKAVPVIAMSFSGNASPLDESHLVIPNARFDAEVVLAGFVQTFPLFERSSFIAVLFPMGRVSGEVDLFSKTFTSQSNGFGDPMLEFDINIIGPKAIKNLPDLLRYEPGFSVDLLFDLILPIGEYDSSTPVNLGLNRWYGRVGAPIVWQLGPWIPGRRTTLEFLPSLWLFADNDDFVGTTLSTDPKFQVEGHLTRDFHKDLWGSFDMTWITGGKATLNGVPGESLNMLGAGFTLGYQINENVQFTAGYMATINDSDPTDLQMDSFKISLVFGWHPIIEGMKRLGGE